MSNTAGLIAFIFFGLSAQAQGNLSELLSLIRAEPKIASPRALEIGNFYVGTTLGGGGRSLDREWPTIDEGLSDPNPAVRDQFCVMFSVILYANQVRPIAVPQKTQDLLITLLSSDNPKTRENVARALAVEAGGAPARAVPQLLELARRDTQQSDRGIAIGALATVTPTSSAIVEFWIQSLKDVANTPLRGMVLSSFRGGSPTDPQVISLVIEALKDNDRFVRQEAIAAITKIGKPAIAALPLLTSIRDTYPSLKSSADAAILAISKP